MIVHWPAGISKTNELRHTPGHLIDLVPTVLEATGLADRIEEERVADGTEQIPPFAGRSLLPTLMDDEPVDREFLWWLHEGNRAVRVGDWKLVAAKGDPWELYNMAEDRAEQTNLAIQMPDKVKELEAVWQKQTNSFTALAKLTTAPQTKQGTKGKKKTTN
jgi:arylsulfatase